MKKFLQKMLSSTTTVSVIVGVLVAVSSVSAATTITTNIDTGGTLNVTGLSTFTYASSTHQSLTGNLLIGGYATTAGASGNFLTQGKVAIGTTSTSVSQDALDVTGTTTSSAGIRVGQTGTPTNQILWGVCGVDFPAFTATASTTNATCTATGVATTHKIFFTASSTLPLVSQFHITAASSTAANTISFEAQNASTTATGSTYNPAVITVQWLAIH